MAKTFKPKPSMSLLRIGYFGSDYFSINCLTRILPLYLSSQQSISHLDVITRSPKLSGRGLNHLKDVPISQFAQSQGINVCRAETAEDFEQLLETKYDLCIAVSYGKLIPESFLKSLPYGGLNVHPSLLPKYAGAAPLQRALLDQAETTGVTVQTLHPTKFDHGDILANAEYKIRPEETFNSLSMQLSQMGGDLLRNVIETRAFDPASATHKVLHPDFKPSKAAKIKKDEHRIEWLWDEAFDIYRRFNTLGPLYTMKKSTKKGVETYRRVIFDDIDYQPANEMNAKYAGEYDVDPSDPSRIIIKTAYGTIAVKEAKVEGLGTMNAGRLATSAQKLFGNTEKRFIET